MKKKVFLSSTAIEMKPMIDSGEYNEFLQINTVSSFNAAPIVLNIDAPKTQSKTMALPGDDDPDPGNDTCY